MRRAHPCPHRKRPRCSPGAQLAVCFGSKSAAAGTGSPSSIARAEERPAKQGGRRGTYPAALSARTARSDAAPPSPSVHLHLRHEHGKIALKGDREEGAAVRGSKVQNIAIRSPLDALHDPPSHAGPRFACCARAARICGGALVQVIVWLVPTRTGRARSPKKRTSARRAESAYQYAFNSAQQSARHRFLSQNATSPPPKDSPIYAW
jgi:hypothetical protein